MMQARIMADTPNLLVTFENTAQLAQAFREELSQGRTFVPGDHELTEGDACTLVIVHPDSGAALEIAGQVAEVTASGVAVAFGLTPLAKGRLAKLAGEDEAPEHLHQRLRNLSATERRKVALTGDHTERVALERIYGKAVWEPLLSNPRLTVAEVVRLSRMGNMPRPLLEQIVTNAAWSKVPQVRRALLANPRLDPPMIMRLLAFTPPAELKLVPKQTAYPVQVRSAAKRLLEKDP